MTKIQIELDKKENLIVNMYKILNNFQTKEQAIKQMIMRTEIKWEKEKSLIKRK